jgi:C4-type Zn-finger protein
MTRFLCVSVLGFALAGSHLLWGQNANSSSETRILGGNDVNGSAVGAYVSEIRDGNKLSRMERQRDPSGNLVPRLATEERVISDADGKRVVERIERRYSPEGRPLPEEKTLIQEEKRADGTTITHATKYQSDINGNPQVSERATTEIRSVGDVTTTSTSVARPDINGALRAAEKIEQTSRKLSDTQAETNVVRQIVDLNGSIRDQEREVTQVTKDANGNSTTNSAKYSTLNGQMEMVQQRVERVSKTEAGEQRVVDIFAADVANSSKQFKLTQRQTVERSKDANGQVKETVKVQEPLFNEPTKLGNAAVVSSVVCSGSCKQ